MFGLSLIYLSLQSHPTFSPLPLHVLILFYSYTLSYFFSIPAFKLFQSICSESVEDSRRASVC